MKRLLYLAGILALVVAAYWVGSRNGGQGGTSSASGDTRKILYYVDPMNPAHTTDKPGLAPCGMKMEPVYADDPSGGKTLSGMPPGTVKIRTDKQQLIGVRIEPVEKKVVTDTLRLLGKVTTDETRTYRINATVDGWITDAMPLASGNHVKKDETLASFYSPEFLSAGQALLFALSSQDRVHASGRETPAQSNQLTQFAINLRQYQDSLRNLGMGQPQIDEMIKTRVFQEKVQVISPADGTIAVRNVSLGQRFDKGTELYRIVDLTRVWILADVFEKEAQFIQPAKEARFSLPQQDNWRTAGLSASLPQFDNTTRTLKLRFEAENKDYLLKPDMFVDVELPVTLPESLVVPIDAVLDSGLRKTVYVDRGEGFFEPRAVRTGWRLGEQVQITEGLMPGDRIVVSGNFLVDSESRMKLAAAGGGQRDLTKDPVCQMVVYDKDKASAPSAQHQGQTYYFCCEGCKEQFVAEPAKFLKPPQHGLTPVAVSSKQAKDLVCGMMVEAKSQNPSATHNGQTYYFCCDPCKQRFVKDPGKYLKPSPVGVTNGPSAGSHKM